MDLAQFGEPLSCVLFRCEKFDGCLVRLHATQRSVHVRKDGFGLERRTVCRDGRKSRIVHPVGDVLTRVSGYQAAQPSIAQEVQRRFGWQSLHRVVEAEKMGELNVADIMDVHQIGEFQIYNMWADVVTDDTVCGANGHGDYTTSSDCDGAKVAWFVLRSGVIRHGLCFRRNVA